MQPIFVPNAPPSIMLGYCRPGQKIHLRVLTANCTVRIASQRELLENLGGGDQFDSTDRTVELQWSGVVYAAGLNSNPAVAQVLFEIK